MKGRAADGRGGGTGGNGGRGDLLLVEDEPGLILALGDRLRAEGYSVEVAATGPLGLERALAGPHDLVLLDVMLPGLSGYDVCRELRERGSDVPVLMLTARGEIADRVIGLKLGADDYLAKPFDTAELLARIEALLRRDGRAAARAARATGAGTGAVDPAEREEEVHSFGDVVVDVTRARLTKAGKPVEFSAMEFRLLSYFVSHPGALLAREELLERVWGYRRDVYSRTVDQHVASLRRKLEDDAARPRHFVTVHGLGYRFEP
jgi:two-component system, OmpR family, alkaline phosphatase synthesis response regulator PhoP